MPPFVDTNVLLRHLLGDHPDHSPRATRLLERVEAGEETLLLSSLPGLILPGKARYRLVFDLYADLNIPFADAFHAVLTQEQCEGRIISFDGHFDRVPDCQRSEP